MNTYAQVRILLDDLLVSQSLSPVHIPGSVGIAVVDDVDATGPWSCGKWDADAAQDTTEADWVQSAVRARSAVAE